MDYLVEKSLSAYVVAMLSSSSDDNCLVLAYGYFDGRQFPAKALWDWLCSAADRHLVLIAGIHGKPGYSAYAAASDGDGFMPMTTVPEDELSDLIKNLTPMFTPCEWPIETIDLSYKSSPSSRIHVLIAEHFHAKLAMTARVDSAFSLFTGTLPSWVATEALSGSSNFTYPAHSYNIEFDMHVRRSDTAALVALSSASRRLVKLALDRATTPGSVSETATDRVIDALSDLLDANENARIERSQRKANADYAAMRKEADADLD